MNINDDKKGFTLVEVMISIVIMAIIFVSVGAVFNNSLQLWIRGSDNIALQQNARYIAESITKEIRASYFTIVNEDELYILLDNQDASDGAKSFRYNLAGMNLIRNTAKIPESSIAEWVNNPDQFTYSGNNVIAYNVSVFDVSQGEGLIAIRFELIQDGYSYSISTKSSPRGVL